MISGRPDTNAKSSKAYICAVSAKNLNQGGVAFRSRGTRVALASGLGGGINLGRNASYKVHTSVFYKSLTN